MCELLFAFVSIFFLGLLLKNITKKAKNLDRWSKQAYRKNKNFKQIILGYKMETSERSEATEK